MLEIDDLDINAFICIDKKYTDAMLPVTKAIHAAGATIDEKIEQIKRLKRLFAAFQSECRSASPQVYELFCKAYLRCECSQRRCYSYIDPYDEQLKQYTENYEALKAEEQYLKTELLMLPNRILQHVKEHKGVRQSELYKVFDPRLWLHVTELLYRFDKKRILRRKVFANTYKLYIDEERARMRLML